VSDTPASIRRPADGARTGVASAGQGSLADPTATAGALAASRAGTVIFGAGTVHRSALDHLVRMAFASCADLPGLCPTMMHCVSSFSVLWNRSVDIRSPVQHSVVKLALRGTEAP
jgi:hypothetical protein